MTSTNNAPTERRRSLRFGWLSLCLWAVVGFALEGAHAFKWAPFLENDMTRLLLRLAHAHGAVLALVVLAHGSLCGDAGDSNHAPPSGRLLRAGALLIPLGFLLGAVAHPEGDPSLGILLTPLGALCFLLGLGQVTRFVWTKG